MRARNVLIPRTHTGSTRRRLLLPLLFVVLTSASQCTSFTGSAKCPGLATVTHPKNSFAKVRFGDYMTGPNRGQPTPEKQMICDMVEQCGESGAEAKVSKEKKPGAVWELNFVRCK